jgi:hypothetical protein
MGKVRKIIVTKEEAFALVRAMFDASAIQGSRDAGTAQSKFTPTSVSDYWWCWVVAFSGSGDFYNLCGLGPVLVDKFTGELIRTGSGSSLCEIERPRGYRSWWDFRKPRSVLDLDLG